jgi:hypothetical protein
VKRALISGGIRCVLWGLAAQMPTALIRAANEELRTVTLTRRIPTRTCLGLPLAAIAAGERGGVAQLVRASACHAEGRGFESRHSRHFSMVASKAAGSKPFPSWPCYPSGGASGWSGTTRRFPWFEHRHEAAAHQGGTKDETNNALPQRRHVPKEFSSLGCLSSRLESLQLRC